MEEFGEIHAVAKANMVGNGGVGHLPIDEEEELLFSRYACHNYGQTLFTMLCYSEEEDELFEKYFVDVPE